MTRTNLRRVLGSAVAIATAAAGLTFVGIAHAATPSVAQSFIPNRIVGPNAGYLGQTAQGFTGTTPIATVTLSGTSKSISEVNLRVSGFLSISRSFEQNDGFAVYADRGVAGFDAADKAAGPVSTGWAQGIPTSAYTPITIGMAGSGATGFTTYFVTVHPSAIVQPNRTVTIAFPAGGVHTTDGNLPSAELTLAPITIDSQPAPKPSRGDFTPVRNAPGVEDVYEVVNEDNGAATGDVKRLAFFNASADTAPANLLTHIGGAPVIHAGAPTGGHATIGDGTGITATTKVARNNQTSNDVFVRSLDAIGNLSDVTALNYDSNATPADQTNDVTAPVYTTATTTLDARGVNTVNKLAAPVKTVVTGNSTTAAPAGQTVAKIASRLFQATGAGTPDPTKVSDEALSTAFTASGTTVNVNSESGTLGGHGINVITESQLLDVYGNRTEPVFSSTGSGATLKYTTYPKDLVQPIVSSVSPESGNSQGVAGDKYRVGFSEPMYTPSIASGHMACPSDSPPQPQAPNAACINYRAPITSSDSVPVSWGADPTVAWNAGDGSLTVTLGSPEGAPIIPGFDPPPGSRRLPKSGDIVDPTDQVQDLAGNPVSGTAIIGTASAVATEAATADTGGADLYGQGRDGRLDQFTITMSALLNGGSVTANAGNFRIVAAGSAGSITPSSATTSTDSDGHTVITLNAVTTLTTDQEPTILLVGSNPSDPNNSSTGVTDSTGQPVRPFGVIASDKAPAALISLGTLDADHNGNLDGLVATYSEAIDHSKEDNTGYYANGDYAENCDPIFNVCFNSKAPSNGTTATTVINLPEQDAPDTAATPSAGYTATSPTFPITDAKGNESPTHGSGATWEGTSTDTTGPAVLSKSTVDVDSDGSLDGINYTFSEPLYTQSVGNATFVVTGHTFTAAIPTGEASVRALISESAPNTGSSYGDTGTTPASQYTGGPNGGITDLAAQPNPAVTEATATAPADQAGPAIVTATGNYPVASNGRTKGDGKSLVAFLSEPMTGAGLDDFLIKQGAHEISPDAVKPCDDGIDDTVADPAQCGSKHDGSVLVFTLGETVETDVLDVTKPAIIALTGPGKISDNADPANTNTQTAPVLVVPFPSAAVKVVCPVASNSGYCRSRTFRVASTGGAGTTGYLLAVSRTTITAPSNASDARFKPSAPTTITVPVDGTYTVRLWTRDAFGNVSAPASTTIKVDAVGPIVNNAKFFDSTKGYTFVNSSSSRYIRDNDVFYVTAAASGPDLGSWPAAGATVDYSGLTARASDARVKASTFTRRTRTSDRCSGGVAGPCADMTFSPRVARGTTLYPAGTLLQKVDSSGHRSGSIWLVADGTKGLVKRRLLSGTAFQSYRYSAGLVIGVPQAVLDGLKTSTTQLYRDGTLFKSSTSNTVYVMTDGQKRVVSPTVFQALGYNSANIRTVPLAEFQKIPGTGSVTGPAHPAGTYVKDSSNRYYVMLTKKGSPNTLVRRRITTSYALSTLVDPREVVRANTADMARPLDNVKRGLREGMLIRTGSSTTYYVVSHGKRRKFNSVTFSQLGFNKTNIANRPGTGDLMTTALGPTVAFHTVRLTIRVTDAAGNIGSRIVSLLGLGTPDALPSHNPRLP